MQLFLAFQFRQGGNFDLDHLLYYHYPYSFDSNLDNAKAFFADTCDKYSDLTPELVADIVNSWNPNAPDTLLVGNSKGGQSIRKLTLLFYFLVEAYSPKKWKDSKIPMTERSKALGIITDLGYDNLYKAAKSLHPEKEATAIQNIKEVRNLLKELGFNQAAMLATKDPDSYYG